ncbi:hypothetical protein LINGRAHAP2_LOCUS25075, partial [Linum grandiflorum]
SSLVRRCRKRPGISWQATSPISVLGDDLLVEILIRSFPDPKSASRCKAVCKQWSSLLSSPRFNRSFVSHHQKKPLLRNELVSVISSFLPPIPDGVKGETLQVFDCYKDLVLCGFSDGYRRPIRQYLICNPFTQKWMALPLAPVDLCFWEPSPVARLVCEPRNSINLDLGGDDDQEQEVFVYSEYCFRVLAMYHDMSPLTLTIDMFCLESGECKCRAVSLPGHVMVRVKDVCSCNGELFWLCAQFQPHCNDN